MKNLSLDKKHFIQGIVIFIVLMTVWILASILTNQFTQNDKGFVSGLGFLLLFAASLHFGQRSKLIKKLFYLALSVLLLYGFSSFILSFLVLGLTDSFPVYCIVNSIFVSFMLSSVLDRLYTIELKKHTIFLCAVCIAASYLINGVYSTKISPTTDLQPGIAIFILFQSFAIIPLLLGLNLKSANNEPSDD